MVLGVTPVLQPHRALWRGEAGGVAGGEDVRIGGAALRVDDDAVLHVEARRGGERVVRLDAGADQDEIGDI